MLYAVQGPAPERNSSLTLSMQLVELCKASGRCGSGGDYDGLHNYLPAAPWRSSTSKTFQGKTPKAAAKESREYASSHMLCDPCALTHRHSSVAR
jgi:hypothetical protein